MKRVVRITCVLLLAGVAAAYAQEWGPVVLGIQGGFTYFKYAGTPFHGTELNLPGANEGLGPALVWLRAPVRGPLALETSVAVGITSNPLSSVSWTAASLRADYLLPRGLYASGGVLADRQEVVSGTALTSELVWGVQAGLGIRIPLGSVIEGRVEGLAQFFEKKGTIPAQNAYSLMIGAGAPLKARATSAARSPADGAADHGPWQLALGTSASVAVGHWDGIAYSVVGVMFPGWGGGNGNFLYSPPAFYVTVPVGGRLALEPSLDERRSGFTTQNSSVFTTSTATLGLRANYAFPGGWYAGAGLVVIGKAATGRPLRGISGVGVQGGYRFHLSGAWGGRLEVSHTMLARQRAASEPAQSVTALSVGATVELR